VVGDYFDTHTLSYLDLSEFIESENRPSRMPSVKLVKVSDTLSLDKVIPNNNPSTTNQSSTQTLYTHPRFTLPPPTPKTIIKKSKPKPKNPTAISPT
jgi:hypothetical protein